MKDSITTFGLRSIDERGLPTTMMIVRMEKRTIFSAHWSGKGLLGTPSKVLQNSIESCGEEFLNRREPSDSVCTWEFRKIVVSVKSKSLPTDSTILSFLVNVESVHNDGKKGRCMHVLAVRMRENLSTDRPLIEQAEYFLSQNVSSRTFPAGVLLTSIWWIYSI